MLALVPHSEKVRASFDSTAMARELINMTNVERRKAGLPALRESSILTHAAYEKAADMLAKSYFSHTSPGGKTFYRWVDNTGYEYSAVAENLAVNLNMVSAEAMVSSWLNSPGHHANLLSLKYSESGIGVAHGIYQGQPAVFAVQIFAAPKAQAAVKTSAVPVLAVGNEKKVPTLVKTAQASVVEMAEARGVKITSAFSLTDESQTSSNKTLEPVKNHQSFFQKIVSFLFVW